MRFSHVFAGLLSISLRSLSVAIVVAGCLSSSTNATTPQLSKETSYIRVMSFNIRYDEPQDKENAWPNRKELVASMIRFHHADLVGVQEALARQLKDLEKLLPDYSWVGVGRADGKAAGEFSAILYRRSRFKHLESSTFWLSETPQVPGAGWDAALPRIVTWVKLHDLQTEKIFYHFNTHFDHRGVRARDESAKLLLDRTAQLARDLPAVVTGDFNFTESSDGYKTLTGSQDRAQSDRQLPVKGRGKPSTLRDARYVSESGHHGPTSTFNEFKALIPDKKIDFVFVKGNIRVLQHGVLSDTWDGRFASDHFPVLAEIIIL